MFSEVMRVSWWQTNGNGKQKRFRDKLCNSKSQWPISFISSQPPHTMLRCESPIDPITSAVLYLNHACINDEISSVGIFVIFHTQNFFCSLNTSLQNVHSSTSPHNYFLCLMSFQLKQQATKTNSLNHQ